jgi:NADH:ubiquinone oxidoreductase subunit K
VFFLTSPVRESLEERLFNLFVMKEIPLLHILILSTLLFFLGVYGFFTRRNLIMMLMSIELILNSINLNFIAFNKYLYPNQLEGIFFTLFIITIAAAEVSLAIAIIINLYRRFKTIDIEDTSNMKW